MVVAWPQVNRVLLGKLLQSFGFDVSMATDGREAVQRFLRQGTEFSCVWMVRFPRRYPFQCPVDRHLGTFAGERAAGGVGVRRLTKSSCWQGCTLLQQMT